MIHSDPYCLTHCRPGIKHSQCGCRCDHRVAANFAADLCDHPRCATTTVSGFPICDSQIERVEECPPDMWEAADLAGAWANSDGGAA